MQMFRFMIGVAAIGAVVVGGFVGFLVLQPYWSPELPIPEAEDAVGWQVYENPGLGFAVEVPAGYTVDVGDEGVRFRYEGTSLVTVAWTDEQTADSHGLWADHEPVGDAELGGRPAKKYEYNHFDAIVGVHTHSWVVPYRGKFLALEVRNRKASMLEEFGIELGGDKPLNAAAQRIVASFRFH